jgi:hypothetical protein
MKHEISEDRSKLTIFFTDKEREELRELPEAIEPGSRHTIHSNATMCDYLEPLTCNSELEWTDSDITGDLTDAPMLAIFGEDERLPIGKEWDVLQGTMLAGRHGGNTWVRPVLERWLFADYMVRSVLEVLRDYGQVVFIGGPYAD